jgi:hypothetical protein
MNNGPPNGAGPRGSGPTPKPTTGLTEDTFGYSKAQLCRLIPLPHAGTLPPAHALHAREILREINRLRVIQAPFGRIFFSLEQRISRLTDEIERRAS